MSLLQHANVSDSSDRLLQGAKKFSDGPGGRAKRPRPHAACAAEPYVLKLAIKQWTTASQRSLSPRFRSAPGPSPSSKLRIHTIRVINTECITCHENINYVHDCFVFQWPPGTLLPVLPASPFSSTFDRSRCSVVPLCNLLIVCLLLSAIPVSHVNKGRRYPSLTAFLAAALLIRATTDSQNTHTQVVEQGPSSWSWSMLDKTINWAKKKRSV